MAVQGARLGDRKHAWKAGDQTGRGLGQEDPHNGQSPAQPCSGLGAQGSPSLCVPVRVGDFLSLAIKNILTNALT